MHELLSNNSLVVGQLYEESVLRAEKQNLSVCLVASCHKPI